MAVANRPQISNTNVTPPKIHRVARGGQVDGAGQSPVTSHGVGAHTRPSHALALRIHPTVAPAARNGTAACATMRQCFRCSASNTVTAVSGTAMLMTVTNATSDPAATV